MINGIDAVVKLTKVVLALGAATCKAGVYASGRPDPRAGRHDLPSAEFYFYVCQYI